MKPLLHTIIMNDSETQRAQLEIQLLESLKTHRKELEVLLERCSSHWGYEDGIYRFYHHSYKVLRLRHTIETILDALQRLLPGRELNQDFMTIMHEGFGNEPMQDGDRRIVEAFFHARFMLEMAVRYVDLQEPPQALPSGYAALLYLYDLR